MIKEGDVYICKVVGKVDTLTSPDLEKTILTAIEEGAQKIVLDVTEMDYISSSGLRVFLITQKKLKAIGGDLVVWGIIDSLKSIFEVAGFTRFFCFVDTKEEALAFFNMGQND